MPVRRAAVAWALLLAASTVAAVPRFGLPQPGGHGPLPGPGSPAGLVPGQDRSLPAEDPLSPQEAAREAQQRNGGGRILSVESASGGWRVKLLKEGNINIVFVPN
jgi:hypothetical protein